jgi:hypothetical protein
MVSVRVTSPPAAFLPVALYVTVPEPAPATDELSFTVEDTLALSVLFAFSLQSEGSVIVFGVPICALRPAPVTEVMVTVAVELFAKTLLLMLVVLASPFLLIKTGADLLDSTPEQTEPKAMLLSARGARPSPSATVLSANATAGKASISANDIKSREILLLSVVRIFDSPLFVVFPADLLSIPPLSSLEAQFLL